MAFNPPKEKTPPQTPPASPASSATPVKAAATKPTGKAKRSQPELNLSAVVVTPVTDNTVMAQGRRQRGERSDTQRQVDKIVETAWKNWQSSGKPSVWTRMPGTKLRVPTTEYETLTYAIRRAGTFYDLKIRFGTAIEDGEFTEVIFVATDRPDEKSDDKTSKASEPSAAVPAPTDSVKPGEAAPTPSQAVNGTGQTEA